jgi:hypothetical protein
MTGINLTRHTRQTVRTLLVPASLLAIGIVPVVAGVLRLAGLMSGQAHADDARFFDNPLPVTLHILAVIPYSLLGALQFAPALRRGAWHRAVGMALVPLGLIAALTGLWMAHFYPRPTGDGEAVYVMRLIVGAAMTISIVRGVVSLLRYEHAAHGAWMLRGYALGMGAGTQVLTHLPWFILVGGRPDEGSRAVMIGLAWIINAVLAEYVIRTRFATRVSAKSGPARPMLPSTI